MKNKRVIKSLSTIQGLQIFQLLRFASIFLTGMILAKGQVPSDIIGGYELMVMTIGLFSFFWVSGFLNNLLSRYHTEDETGKSSLIFNCFILLLGFGTCMALIMCIFLKNCGHLIDDRIQQLTFYLACYLPLYTAAFLNEYILLLKNKTRQLIQYGFIGFILNVTSVAIPLLFTHDLKITLLILIAVALLKNIYLIYLLQKYTTQKADTAKLQLLFYTALPLIFGMLISGSADYIDGLLISTHFTNEQFAIFRYGAKELPVGLLMANAMSTAMVPVIADNPHSIEKLARLKQESKRLMHILFPLTMLLLITSGFMYPIIFRDTFSASAPIFNICLLLIISRLVFPQTIVMALRDNHLIFFISIAEISINIIASYCLMHVWGMNGVVWGTVIAFAAEKVLLAYFLFRKHTIHPYSYIPIKTFTMYSISVIILFIIVENFGLYGIPLKF